jgi:hypothetical protein
MMKIALTRRTEKTHHLNYSILMKRTCQIKIAKLVPVFAARWRSIYKYFINSENKQPERRYKIQQQNKEKRHTPVLKGKEIQPNQVKAIIILISTSTNKHMHNTNLRCKKNRECLVQLYEAIIPI